MNLQNYFWKKQTIPRKYFINTQIIEITYIFYIFKGLDSRRNERFNHFAQRWIGAK